MITTNDGTFEHSPALERPRTDVRKTGNLAVLNAELVLNLNGESTASFDVRNTFSGTLVVEASEDGTNYISVPFFNTLTETFATTTTVAGAFKIPLIAAYRVIRVRASTLASGTATVSLEASLGNFMIYDKPIPSNIAVTTITTANTAGTLTIASPGAGLFHYITSIKIKRINNSAAAITGTALLAITTTNFPGALAFSSGNALAVGEDKTDEDLNFTGNPLKSSVANTATTIVMPAGGVGVQYRASVTYYIGA